MDKDIFKNSTEEIKKVLNEPIANPNNKLEIMMLEEMLKTTSDILHDSHIVDLCNKMSEKIGEELAKELFESLAIVISKIHYQHMGIINNIIPKCIYAVLEEHVKHMNETTIKSINETFTNHEGLLKILRSRLDALEKFTKFDPSTTSEYTEGL